MSTIHIQEPVPYVETKMMGFPMAMLLRMSSSSQSELDIK